MTIRSACYYSVVLLFFFYLFYFNYYQEIITFNVCMEERVADLAPFFSHLLPNVSRPLKSVPVLKSSQSLPRRENRGLHR